MSSAGADDSREFSGPSTPALRAKRAQVPVACEQCRRKKVKCDGARPCRHCSGKGLQCSFIAQEGESRQQALKRKYDDIVASHAELSELFDLIPTLTSDGAGRLVEGIRGGDDPGTALRKLKQQRSSNELTPTRPRTFQDATHILLRNILQCTSSMVEVCGLIDTLIASLRNERDVSLAALEPLRNRVVHPQTITSMLDLVLPNVDPTTVPYIVNVQDAGHRLLLEVDDRLDVPVYQVPAKPWTQITSDDSLVSHLISAFINFPNVYWRYVEEDLFLKAMVAGDLESDFCSPFLVNAMCAIASLNSEHPGVLSDSGEVANRGEQFHEEALRLWYRELGRPSIKNLQALVILSMDTNYRGKDKLGMNLLSTALHMSAQMPINDGVEYTSDNDRARVGVAWALHFVDATCCFGLMRPSAPVDKRLAHLPNMPDAIYTWHAKPFIPVSLQYRGNVLLRERCVVNRLTVELGDFLFSNSKTSAPDVTQLQKAAVDLATRLENWIDLLPADLAYSKDLAAPMFELHAEYQCAIMTLSNVVADKLQSLTSSETTGHGAKSLPTAADWTNRALVQALASASILRDYREKYGLKMIVAFIFQAAAVSAFTLLPYLRPDATIPPGFAREALHAAFTEAFRCLLGIAARVMIARGVVQMVRQSAESMGIPDVVSIKPAVLEVVWREGDAKKMSSDFPSFAIEGGGDGKNDEGPRRMEEMLSEWEGSMRVS